MTSPHPVARPPERSSRVADAGAAGWVRGVRREGERCGPEGHELPTQATYVYMYVYTCMRMCMCMHVYVCVCVCMLCTGTGNEQVGRAAAPSCNEEAHSPSLPQASLTAIYLVS